MNENVEVKLLETDSPFFELPREYLIYIQALIRIGRDQENAKLWIPVGINGQDSMNYLSK